MNLDANCSSCLQTSRNLVLLGVRSVGLGSVGMPGSCVGLSEVKDLKQVVKLSWPSDLRPPEADLLRRARDHGVDGVAKLLGHRPITSIEELRDGLTLPDS
jgi:hypothetical protein